MRIGLIGAGAIARRVHLPALKLIDEIEVTWLCDKDEELCRKVADEFNVRHCTTDYQRILDDNTVDMVDICTPTQTHHEIAKAALLARKHVLVEKPLTLSLAEAIDLYKQLRSSGLQLCIIQNWRYQDSVFNVRDRLAAGHLGRVISIHGQAFNHLPVGWTRSRWLYHKHAVLYDFTPHLVDLVLWLNPGKIVEVHAYGRTFTEYADFLSSSQLCIRFDDKSVALLDASWEVNYRAFLVQVYGTGGRIALDPNKDMFEESHGAISPLHETRTYTKRMSNLVKGVLLGKIAGKFVIINRSLFQDFLTSIETQSEPPMTIEQGVRVNIVLEAAKLSIDSGEPVNLRNMLRHFALDASDMEKLLLPEEDFGINRI